MEFCFETAERGQEVSEETYNNCLNVLPPVRLHGGQGWFAGFQMGGAVRHSIDTRAGRLRAMYHTFTERDGHYFYQGVNFAGEIDSREFEAGVTLS